MPSCLVKPAFYRPGSFGVSSYLPAAPDHWLNLRSCVAVSSGLSQQDQNKQVFPILCLCVSVCTCVSDSASGSLCRDNHSFMDGSRRWEEKSCGRPDAGGTPSGIRSHLRCSIWVWPPLTPIKHLLPHASPPKLNAKIQSKLPFRCALQRKRQTGDVCLATGRNLPASARWWCCGEKPHGSWFD